MREEWKIKGKLLQELNALRIRIEQLDKAEHSGKNVELKVIVNSKSTNFSFVYGNPVFAFDRCGET
ncbi:hypothetical protein ACFL5Z_18925 [Planctomycetota bacterium]